tara:strand:+ start:640 stop:1134 length:495 start_codon:yes stop_codon:yes gene_type:complete
MRKILILLIGVLIISCNQRKKENQRTDVKSTTLIEKSENFDWLLGKWKRLDEVEGKETFENWKKIKETEYSGIGFTMQNGDTIKQEKIRLIKTSGKWNLTVKVPEESESITFNGVSHNENEFTCENNEIDFPNKIKYWKNENKINATVSGGEMKISFEFEKLDN